MGTMWNFKSVRITPLLYQWMRFIKHIYYGIEHQRLIKQKKGKVPKIEFKFSLF